jgi:hypothetical protein
MRRFFLRSGLPTLLACLGLAAPATSEVYQWVDENGSISFSDRLHRVPQAARSTLVRRSSEPETAFLAATGGTDRDRPNSRNGVFVVPFERMDALIQVSVRLNEEVTAPFYVDTAASSVVIPAALAARLDLDPDSAAKIRSATSSRSVCWARRICATSSTRSTTPRRPSSSSPSPTLAAPPLSRRPASRPSSHPGESTGR